MTLKNDCEMGEVVFYNISQWSMIPSVLCVRCHLVNVYEEQLQQQHNNKEIQMIKYSTYEECSVIM